MAEILNHPRVYAFLHIPVQSGSDAVLTDMKREYHSQHFEKIMDYMIEQLVFYASLDRIYFSVPGIYIATDFICAFPTETKEDFEDSMSLVRKYKFPSLFINQYYPRKGTPAARMKKVGNIVVEFNFGISRLIALKQRNGQLQCLRCLENIHVILKTGLEKYIVYLFVKKLPVSFYSD